MKKIEMKKYYKLSDIVEAVQWYKGDEPLKCMIPYGESVLEQFPQYEGFYFIDTVGDYLHVASGRYVVKDCSGVIRIYSPVEFKRLFGEIK